MPRSLSSRSPSSFSGNSILSGSSISLESVINLGASINKTPFSILNELSQMKLLDKVAYSDKGAVGEQLFAARVEVEHAKGTLYGDAIAANKRAAKQAAAHVVLDRLSGKGITDEPRFPFDPHDLGHHQSLTNLAQHALDSGATLITIDVEAYEMDPTRVTEVGISVLAARDIFLPHPRPRTEHWIVREHTSLRNGLCVPDHKDDFDFGVSKTMGLAEIPAALAAVLGALHGLVALVGHSIDGDIRWLENLGCELRSQVASVVDIARVDKVQRKVAQIRKLEKMLAEAGITTRNLHNGGNDAQYTMEVCASMMRRLEFERVDAQVEFGH